MIAYHGSEQEKREILDQLRAHEVHDQIVKGQYWENGKGCAVGCTVHSSNHAEYEYRFGIPEMLARLEDRIFEGLPNEIAKAWPVRFMSAIRPGADLSLVGWQFQHWLLTTEIVNPGITHPIVRDAVAQCATLIADLAAGKSVSVESAARSAESARLAAELAWSAARSAESARLAWSAAKSARLAWSAAESARSAESARLAARLAWSAAKSARLAWSAARSAESAAESARLAWSAAELAWSAAESARLARSAESAAENSYVAMADKIVALLGAS